MEIIQTLNRVNWRKITPLGLLSEQLMRLRPPKSPDKAIVDILKMCNDEFVVVKGSDKFAVPDFLRGLRKIAITRKEPVKTTLSRHFSDTAAERLSSFFIAPREIVTQGKQSQETDDIDETVEESEIIGAAPVEEEIEVKFPPGILRRIRKVLDTVRERIGRRNSISNLRDRYVFVATEYFKSRDVSTEFLSFYVDTVCGVRVELVNNLGKVVTFLETSVNEGFEVIVDDMMTYKEKSEKFLAMMDVNKLGLRGRSEAGYTFAELLVAKARMHMENGQKIFGEYLIEE